MEQKLQDMLKELGYKFQARKQINTKTNKTITFGQFTKEEDIIDVEKCIYEDITDEE